MCTIQPRKCIYLLAMPRQVESLIFKVVTFNQQRQLRLDPMRSVARLNRWLRRRHYFVNSFVARVDYEFD